MTSFTSHNAADNLGYGDGYGNGGNVRLNFTR